jgi:hypothetical protein
MTNCQVSNIQYYVIILLPDLSYLVFQIGKFFGEVDGALLTDLVEKKVYRR